jgi:DNA primase
MGTALTEAQLELLWRLIDAPILCFDGDSAGQRAASRAAERAMANLRPGKQLLIVLLPGGRDPDDVVREGGRPAFEKALEGALPLATFLYRTEAEKIDRERPEQRAALRQRLEELAQSCEDRFVSDEFARSLRSLFYEDFGWGRDKRKGFVGPVLRTSPRANPDLGRLYVRSALYGLTRYPAVAAEHVETLAAIQIDHKDLRTWRNTIIEAVTEKPDLTPDGIQEALEVNLLPELLTFDVCRDLRFGFTRKATDPERAMKQLDTLVTFLAQEQDVTGNLDRLDAAAVEDAGGDRYIAIEAERQRFREARAGMLRAAADWDEEAA